MSEVKRFHFDSVCGDTGLIDEEAELKWWITNVCSVTDLKDNWKSARDKLNELAEENDVLKQQLKTKYIVNKQYEEKIRLEKENEQLKSTLAFRSNQLALMESLIDDLGGVEMKRQMMEILND